MESKIKYLVDEDKPERPTEIGYEYSEEEGDYEEENEWNE